MRTTITLDTQVLEQLKERATSSGASVSRLIEQAGSPLPANYPGKWSRRPLRAGYLRCRRPILATQSGQGVRAAGGRGRGTLWEQGLATSGETRAAFERRCIPAEPRRFAALCVAFRSKYTWYSSLTRLVSRAPRHSRRSPRFHHKLLASAATRRQRTHLRASGGWPGACALRSLAARIDRLVRTVCAVRNRARRVLADCDEPKDLRSANADVHRDPVLPEPGGSSSRGHGGPRTTPLGDLCRAMPEHRRPPRKRRLPGGPGDRARVRAGQYRQRFRTISGAALETPTRSLTACRHHEDGRRRSGSAHLRRAIPVGGPVVPSRSAGRPGSGWRPGRNAA